ncbi:unnamed protein product [Porites evermanni]|uniref:Uromodulin n=1 Tax=Porites evermanni TaxID=104178 RepID=A0ABN8LXN9_9CNID|nr:unnamed protein product [Porites evermanni]
MKALKQIFCMSVISVLGQVHCVVVTAQCSSSGYEISILGWMLQGHIYKTMEANSPLDCLFACREDDRCQSFNWVISLHLCEFNNRTKEARSEDFVSDPNRFYFRRYKNRVPLGSIPELPAETCKEIKASEEQAVSGKYWLYTIKENIPVLAHCDMETFDIDECSATSPVCDVNANCTNTRGSYLCTCKIGFSGDGKTCKVSDCLNYQNLTNGNRKVSHGSSPLLCDNSLPHGWYRFQGNAGTKMPTSCIAPHKCSTHATGWLNGAHLSVEEGKVTKKVCFNWQSNCCRWSINIEVINCGDFFLYHFRGTPPEHSCHLRYCGTD